jgi:hypothetical protein
MSVTKGKTLSDESKNEELQPVSDEFIRSLRGCCKGEDSLVEAREREHRIEKQRMLEFRSCLSLPLPLAPAKLS